MWPCTISKPTFNQQNISCVRFNQSLTHRFVTVNQILLLLRIVINLSRKLPIFSYLHRHKSKLQFPSRLTRLFLLLLLIFPYMNKLGEQVCVCVCVQKSRFYRIVSLVRPNGVNFPPADLQHEISLVPLSVQTAGRLSAGCVYTKFVIYL